MKHRIRAAALVVKDGGLLLVKHRHPETGAEWWIPPGGGLLTGETLYDCAVREAYEETGLTVELGQILYLSEFVDLDDKIHHLEVFILANSFKGNLTIKNVPSDETDASYIKAAQFFSPKEMTGLVVFPEILKEEFWRDLASGRLVFRYLGQHSAHPSIDKSGES